MATKTKNQTKSRVSAVTKIQTVSKSRFGAAVRNSESSSEVLRRLGIYENGRNVSAVKQRVSSERLAFAK